MKNIILFLLIPNIAISLDFFNSGVDYWEISEKNKNRKIVTKDKGKKNSKSFNWKPYLDVNSQKFARSGDNDLSPPFVEAYRSPTKENIKKLKRYEKLRKKQYMKFQNIYLGETSSRTNAVQSNNKLTFYKIKELTSQFKFRYFTDINCPYCKKMNPHVSQMKKMGFIFDSIIKLGPQGPYYRNKKLISKKEYLYFIEKHQVKGTPKLIISDIKNKKMLPPLKGMKTFNNIINYIQTSGGVK